MSAILTLRIIERMAVKKVAVERKGLILCK